MQTLSLSDWQILCSAVLLAAAAFSGALIVAFRAGYEQGYRAGLRQQKLFGRLKLGERE
jgi:hypothetical protein